MKRIVFSLAFVLLAVSCSRDELDLKVDSTYDQNVLRVPSQIKDTLSNGLVVIKEGDHYRNGDMLFAIPDDGIETRGVTFVPSGRQGFNYHLWPNRTVYYKFAPSSPSTLKSIAKAAMKELSDSTGVRFAEASSSVSDYVLFEESSEENSSYVGKKGGVQEIKLVNYYSKYICMHEIMHALGIFHEHQRADRSSYIKIKTENIVPGALSNFSAKTGSDYYDIGEFNFESIMLYGATTTDRSIAKDPSKPIMTKLDGSTFKKNRSYLSRGDVETVRAVYGPPYHRLETEIDVYQEYVCGIEEVYDAWHESYLRFYEDEACTEPAVTEHPRKVTIKETVRYLYAEGREDTTSSYFTITVPAGVSSYHIGGCRNQEIYFCSNAYKISFTTYSVYEPTHVPDKIIELN